MWRLQEVIDEITIRFVIWYTDCHLALRDDVSFEPIAVWNNGNLPQRATLRDDDVPRLRNVAFQVGVDLRFANEGKLSAEPAPGSDHI